MTTQAQHTHSWAVDPHRAGPEGLEEYRWAAFIHAQGHDEAGSDFELCDGDCSYWPDAHDPNEDQPYDPSGDFYDPDA
jgi:hypothetical protein